jgi:hypothetical protein
MTKELPNWVIARLKKIASLDDKLANHHLETTGSYACFDEPGSVRIAREILADAGALSSKEL